MKIYLIRHGKTHGNLLRQYVGSTDEPLCREGREEIISRIKLGYYPAGIGLVYTSGMKRCEQTARLIWPQCFTKSLVALRECDFGRFEGKTYDLLKEDPDYRTWIGGESSVIPQGEDSSSFRARCAAAFASLAPELLRGDAPAVLVLHGGVIMAVLEAYCGDMLENALGDYPNARFYRWQLPNGGMLSAELALNGAGMPALTGCRIVPLPEKGDRV